MFSYFLHRVVDVATLSCVLISCRALMTTNDSTVEVIQVTKGMDFTLNCPMGDNSSTEVHWLHDGLSLDGIEVVEVTKSDPSDGGIYICNGTSGVKTMYVIIGNKTIKEGESFALHCKGGNTNASRDLGRIYWTKNGNVLTNWTGMDNFTVLNAQLNDGGVYICNNSGSVTQTNVVVGKRPSVPPEPECFDSLDTVIQCKAYPGEFRDANRICITIESIGLSSRIVECHNCSSINKTVTCNLDFGYNQWRTEYEITTKIDNYVTSSRRAVSYENLQHKVIPDKPTIVNMTATSIDSFITWFRIPETWNENIRYNARGLYTQNGGERQIANLPSDDEYIYYTGQYGLFQFNTNKSLAYSLVCLQIQIKFYYGFEDTTWGSASEPVCAYTHMTQPSGEPAELNMTFEQDKESPEFRNVMFSWKPPLKQYRNGIIDHYQLLLNKIELNKEDTVKNETIPGNVTNIVFSRIESYETFSASLTAWTQVGKSPERTVVIDSMERPHTVIRRMLVIAITITSVISLIILGRITWITRQKVSADHLPEPYFIPEDKMRECLAKKRFLPEQKEVFDDLKGKGEEVSPNITDHRNTSYYVYKPSTPSKEVETPFVSCSASSSEVSQGTAYKSSSGASCYMLVSSTDGVLVMGDDGALPTDDTVCSHGVVNELGHVSESKSLVTKGDGENYAETKTEVDNEFDHPKMMIGEGMYGELGCYDGKVYGFQDHRPYVNCNSGVPHEDWGDKGQTLQLCNDTENPGYNNIKTVESDEDRHYQNYTPFESRVHDTMSKLNGNVADV